MQTMGMRMITVQVVPDKGRAMVATSFIGKAKVIESAPTVSFCEEDRETMKGTSVFGHCFVRVNEYRKGVPSGGFLVFGLMALCNHSENPNAYVDWQELETGVWANLVSLRDIGAGEEITLYYADKEEYTNKSEFKP